MIHVIRSREKIDDISSRFDTIRKCDRETDRQTDGQTERQTNGQIDHHRTTTASIALFIASRVNK